MWYVISSELPVYVLSGVNSLAQALSANPAVPTTLTHLDLCGNSLRGDDLPVCTSPSRSC